jgi:chemotaxis protein MotB
VSGGGGHGKRRGQHEEHEEHENHERWLVSYADMMTLLMVLFIVMFAISQVDQRKFMALKTGLAAASARPWPSSTGRTGCSTRRVGGPGHGQPGRLRGDGKASAADKANRQKQEQAQAAAVAKLVDATTGRRSSGR